MVSYHLLPTPNRQANLIGESQSMRLPTCAFWKEVSQSAESYQELSRRPLAPGNRHVYVVYDVFLYHEKTSEQEFHRTSILLAFFFLFIGG